jgi:hypothetical protein
MKFSIIFVIVFVTLIGMSVISVHGEVLQKQADAAVLVKIFGDEFDFSTPEYQMKWPDIFFADGDGYSIHRYHEDVTMELFFNSLSIGIDDQCFEFPDGKSFCTSNILGTYYSLKYFINGQSVSDIRNYIIQNNDRILITYGDDEDIESYLSQLNLIKIKSGHTTIGFESDDYEKIKSETKTNLDKIYTYAEIYATSDQARYDCEFKYGPPFNSMNQQFAYNDCYNNVNTWELNQLDRTDYYGEPQRESSGGGCLIATATYGSEMSTEVQQLRELRDNQLLNTESGTAFMTMFNDVYYSFSPVIADYERENPLFKEAVKLAITPMISSLSLMENAESESEVLSIGISVIMLNIGMYLAVPAVMIVGIRKRI